jgi:hypothetical protein
LADEVMAAKYRNDARYRCSQKAVLLTGGNAGNLCVITNISNGGLCLAVVGSSRPQKHEQISVKINHNLVACSVVNNLDTILHCRFDNPVHARSDAHRSPFSPLAVLG